MGGDGDYPSPLNFMGDAMAAYVKLGIKELQKRAEEALARLGECKLCPRECGVNRLAGEKGFCRTGRYAWIASFGPHFGEERVLVGGGGSGTIFFTHCNMACVFCQNYTISHLGEGREVLPQELAQIMLHLQKRGCENINFVTPTHVVPQILEALVLALEGGLNLPLVYNCGGYESVETLKLLDGIFDIYMPDAKYGDDEVAEKLSGIKKYTYYMKEALKEMHSQVGDLVLDKRGVAQRGLLVRHLVLPKGLAGTGAVMRFLAEEISRDTFVNIMEQYRPCYRAFDFPEISRPITIAEYEEALKIAREEGLWRFAL